MTRAVVVSLAGLREGQMNDLEPKPSIRRSQWNLIFLILAVSACSVMYRIIVLGKLEQTAALFVGIPAVLAILLAMVPKAKTVMGGSQKASLSFCFSQVRSSAKASSVS